MNHPPSPTSEQIVDLTRSIDRLAEAIEGIVPALSDIADFASVAPESCAVMVKTINECFAEKPAKTPRKTTPKNPKRNGLAGTF